MSLLKVTILLVTTAQTKKKMKTLLFVLQIGICVNLLTAVLKFIFAI